MAFVEGEHPPPIRRANMLRSCDFKRSELGTLFGLAAELPTSLQVYLHICSCVKVDEFYSRAKNS